MPLAKMQNLLNNKPMLKLSSGAKVFGEYASNIYADSKIARTKKRAAKSNIQDHYTSYIYNLEGPNWMYREYNEFAKNAYIKNVVANRAISVIAQGAASVPWSLYRQSRDNLVEVKQHPLLSLLNRPNPLYAGVEFFENLYAYRMISGNVFIHALGIENSPPKELHILRPDRVNIIPGKNGMPVGYHYIIGEYKKVFPIDQVTGQSSVLHIKNFHPLNDWYGLPQVESAVYSVDQHNEAAIWNKSLLTNSARPSGALVMKDNMSGEQFDKLREQITEQFAGPGNSGKPMLLEGGVDWKEISLSPKEMDFIEAKNSAARDIALAFGVPPQLLGLPGDNTYSNMQEARLALWEETILPLLDHMTDALNHWLVPMFGDKMRLAYNKDEISALSTRRENIWARIESASFLTLNEKRAMIGLSPIEGEEQL